MLHCCIIHCALKLHSLLSGVKDTFHELLFSVNFGVFGFYGFFGGETGVEGFVWLGFFNLPLLKTSLVDNISRGHFYSFFGYH